MTLCTLVLCIATILLALTNRPTQAADFSPPTTDYCEMLARDIVGRQHGFLAGNHLYYVGGASDVNWRTTEHETLGFTHPLFRDGRARGFGIAKGAGGVGHDQWGWEFWRRIRAAYGTVIIDGERYQHPQPQSMIWRPDRQVCTYRTGEAKIRETKFITSGDVLIAIITTDRPVTIEFAGRSFENNNWIGSSDGDPRRKYPISTATTARYDQANNSIHLVERGRTVTKPTWGEPIVEGRTMYDGMSVVLSASQDFSSKHTIRRADDSVQHYTMTFDVSPERPLVLAYAMGDDYVKTVAAVRRALADPEVQLDAKTEHINDLLNQQIPYFRCSDEKVVQTYYYLWSLYFLYFTEIGRGFEQYPHTQTAVNNFMGLHLWDSWAYTAVGAWTADKWRWGFGNILAWRTMVPFKSHNGGLPDNFGVSWYSPRVRMNLVGGVEQAWRQYEQSGDRRFLDDVYGRLFRPLYWERIQGCYGIEIDALDTLVKMATALDRQGDVDHWLAMRPAAVQQFRNTWEDKLPDYYAGRGARWKDIWHLSSMHWTGMPDADARAMVRRWVMNTETGFTGPVPFDIRTPDSVENGVFAVSSISTWLALEGMFRHGCGDEAIYGTLVHVEGMTRDHGYPIAPECWDPDYKPWGSMYYNWDCAILPLLIERLAGVRYSIPEDTLTVSDHLPDTWSFVETRTPIVTDGRTHWTRVRIDRPVTSGGRDVVKRVTVDGCPLATIKVRSWLEDRPLRSASVPELAVEVDTIDAETATRYGSFQFENTSRAEVAMTLGRRDRTRNTLAYLTPHSSDFVDRVDIRVENLRPETALRYTTDGSDPTETSRPVDGPISLTETTTLRFRAFGGTGTTYHPMSAVFTRREMLDPIASVDPTKLRAGLRYECYEGEWNRLPDVSSLRPVATGISPNISPDCGGRDTRFALRFTGYIKIDTDGFYRFHLRSDDGSRLAIDGRQVINLDTISARDAWEKSGTTGLRAGLHKIEILYFQHDLRKTLRLTYGKVGEEERIVPADRIFHKQE